MVAELMHHLGDSHMPMPPIPTEWIVPMSVPSAAFTRALPPLALSAALRGLSTWPTTMGQAPDQCARRDPQGHALHAVANWTEHEPPHY